MGCVCRVVLKMSRQRRTQYDVMKLASALAEGTSDISWPPNDVPGELPGCPSLPRPSPSCRSVGRVGPPLWSVRRGARAGPRVPLRSSRSAGGRDLTGGDLCDLGEMSVPVRSWSDSALQLCRRRRYRTPPPTPLDSTWVPPPRRSAVSSEGVNSPRPAPCGAHQHWYPSPLTSCDLPSYLHN